MEHSKPKNITVETTVNAPVEKIWHLWTTPEHIIEWNFASEDWHTPKAENDLRIGGRFLSRMEARNGTLGFDFTGIYQEIIPFKKIMYTIADGRLVTINFIASGQTTRITEQFEAENTHPEEMQRTGWQSILDNFKRYAESNPILK